MNTCDNCKWWGYPQDVAVQGAHRYCSHKASAYWSQERKEPDSFYSVGEHNGNTVIVGTLTGPKFGCVHFEQKTLTSVPTTHKNERTE